MITQNKNNKKSIRSNSYIFKHSIVVFILLFCFNIFPQKGELKYGEEMYIESYDPLTSLTNYASFRLSQLIYETLITKDNFGAIIPLLATNWQVLRDGYEIKFNLNSNAKWHNGKTVTSDDVVFTFNALKNSNYSTTGPYKKIMDLDTVYALSEREVVFKFKNYEPTLLSIFTNIPILPQSIFKDSRINEGILFNNPIGSGPFMFDYRTNDRTRVILKAFDQYRDKVNIKKITAHTVVDPQLSLYQLLTKSIDLKVNVRAKDISTLESQGGFEISAFNSLRIDLFSINFNNSLLKNLQIRKAMVYGFNRSETFKNIYLGKGVLLSGPFSPGSWGFNPKVNIIPFDPNRADNLLRDIGARDTDGDGIKELNKSPLKFELLVPVGKKDAIDDFTIQVADIFKAQMRKIGIDIQIKREEWNKFVNLLKNKQFDLAYHSIIFDEKSDISPFYYSKGASNFSNYNNKEVDKLFEVFFKSNDSEQMRTIYYRLHEILADDVPAIFLWTPEQFTAYISRRIRGDIYFDPFKFFTPKVREWIIDENY